MELNQQYRTQASTPLPLGEAIRGLPGQYMKVMSRPSVRTFAEEKGKASWGVIWVQFVSLSIISAILLSIGLLISPPNFGSAVGGIGGLSSTSLLVTSIVFSSIIVMLLTPVSFLLAGGILYLIARVFGGRGLYREQIYTTLLFGVPLVILSSLLSLIPGAGAWLLYVPHIYSVVLLVMAMMAVHQFGRGKAK
ncbi:MAG TPA: Yip1 family protein [Ktedonobacteraceae bacterium]